ncbi:MAG: carbohydrate kinase family protein [Clostridia bacterium]|nr:carbohydrate kinase family protein [Clostridia bacterium]
MKVFVSGILGIETTLAVRGFPVSYYPVDYPFFGIRAEVAGSAYRMAKSFRALGDDVRLYSFVGDDVQGRRVFDALDADGLPRCLIDSSLAETVETVVLQEIPFGRRQVYCDLKDVQERRTDVSDERIRAAVGEADACAIMNVNFNRPILALARELGKTIACDVQALASVTDSFNAEFIEYADILFLSDEGAPGSPEDFLAALAERCNARVIVMGLAADGVLCYDREKNNMHKLKAVDVGKVLSAGAGAALMSSFLHYYGRYDTAEALKRAEVFSALKLAANAAGGGYPTERDVEDKLAAVEF